MWTQLLLIIFVGFQTIRSDCGIGYYDFPTGSSCTVNSCYEQCEEHNCCLKSCFPNDAPLRDSLQELSSEIQNISSGQQITCSLIETSLKNIAIERNSTAGECYRHMIALLKEHKDSIAGFNPVECPCEHGYHRTEGKCLMTECHETGSNEELCVESSDDYFNKPDICCVSNKIYPQDACLSGFSPQILPFTANFASCNTTCSGSCSSKSPGIIPTCCLPHSTRKVTEAPPVEEGGKLHSAVIAVLVVFVIMLLVAVGLGLLYFIRKKSQKNKTQRTIRNEPNELQLTALHELHSDADYDAEIVSGAYDNSIHPSDIHDPEADGKVNVQGKVLGEYDSLDWSDTKPEIMTSSYERIELKRNKRKIENTRVEVNIDAEENATGRTNDMKISTDANDDGTSNDD
ncbi:uncharacterized protein LOC128224765 isoform X2 [Mya arenaria]|uniref:uncharacterized protein LOC128224765 isoform X2 n=1 Tax=Mya arenaria TaxID=6604 RepID=UPI0022E1C719|nr:uncharacterized protein LOC128224765 isoform X2 [Mya arenaria]